jgi:hypothetical protein
MNKPTHPSTLIYDCGVDPELLLKDRLEDRSREGDRLHVIVRLKSGTTHVGRICYFDSSRLTLAQSDRTERLCDFNYSDIARILISPKVS